MPFLQMAIGAGTRDHSGYMPRAARADDFAVWIRAVHERRKAEGRATTQRQAAKTMGVDEWTLGRWFNGHRLPDYDDLVRLIAYYGLDAREALFVVAENERRWGGVRKRKGVAATPRPRKTPPVDQQAAIEALEDLAAEIPGTDRRRPLREGARRSAPVPERRANSA